mmetsp:Transcript_7733/g.35112  ORF Transcript_7733/g.35112 Transcript_7733/m.35112 type:complete len:265 (+) Transcript_7733:1968-2762(+)
MYDIYDTMRYTRRDAFIVRVEWILQTTTLFGCRKLTRAGWKKNHLFSRPGGELEHLADDLEAGGDLPGEEREVDAVERDVKVPRLLVAPLHLRHETRRHGPQAGDRHARVEVGAGEELAGAEVGVHATLDGQSDAKGEEQGTPVVVLLLVVAGDELLALRGELVDLLLGLELRRRHGGRGGRLHLAVGGHRGGDGRGNLLLEILDLLTHGPDLAPLQAEVARVHGREPEASEEQGMDQSHGAALEDAELAALGERLLRAEEDGV